MRSDDADNRGVRWRRRDLPKSVATPCTNSGANANANSNSDTDPNTDPNTLTDANADPDAGRRHDGHHYVGGRLTEDADGAGGDTRDIREQRHAGTRDGLQSASGAHRLS